MKLHEFIDENLDLFKAMVKCGLVSHTVMHYYNIFNTFQACSYLPTKTKQWIYTAVELKTSQTTVITAIKTMESQIKINKPKN